MFTIIFAAALIWVALKADALIFRATWGIAKIFCTVLLAPLLIIGLVYVGLVYFVVPILVVLGLAILIGCLAKA